MRRPPAPADRKLEKNIYYRGPHQFRVKVMQHGHSVSETFETLEQARDFRDSKRIRKNTDADYQRVVGANMQRRKQSATKLRDVLGRYRDEVSAHKVMPQAEIYRIEAIRRSALGAMPFFGVQGDDIKGFLADLQAGRVSLARPRKSAATTKKRGSGSNALKYLAILSHAYNVARREWKLAASNPVDDITKPRAAEGEDRRVPDAEFRKLHSELLGSDNPCLAPMSELALWTGARMGELLTLHWDQVSWSDRTLTIAGHYDARGRAEVRTVPFDFVTDDKRVDRLLKSLERVAGRRGPGALVFPTTQSAIEQAWRRARARAGIPDIKFHHLRHEAISRLYDSGRWNDLEIMTGVGHRSLAMTKRYAHLKLAASARLKRSSRRIRN